MDGQMLNMYVALYKTFTQILKPVLVSTMFVINTIMLKLCNNRFVLY